jgi:hypothetical protein
VVVAYEIARRTLARRHKEAATEEELAREAKA